MARVTELPLSLPKGLSRAERLEIADLVIEFIVDRTLSGKDKDGKPFKKSPGARRGEKYSKSYVDSLDFKNAGKSPSDINLQLSGDMLAALAMLDEKDGKIVVGYEKGSDEEGRAEGNILGSYGGDPDPKKARPFLGIKPNELKKIIELVREEHGDQ